MFELAEKNMKNDVALNDELKLATKKINAFQQIAKNSIYAISMILSHICEYPSTYFENSNYSTIAEYSE